MDKKIIKSKIYLVMLKNYFRAKLIHGQIILMAKSFFKDSTRIKKPIRAIYLASMSMRPVNGHKCLVARPPGPMA